ncbi:MAG: phosphatase PAP2 family protein [Anaerolineaceae bacterium]|nr:phosphatase PAP2 family protein [Anaerolineaceae bacterium]
MSKKKRFLLLLIPLLIQSFYFPLNRLSSGGVRPEIPLDHLIPVWPVWAVPYLLVIYLWVGGYIWAAMAMEDELFKVLLISSIAAILAGQISYALFPTYVERPLVTGHDWAADLLRYVYAHDGLYNALPSGHAYLSTVMTLVWMRWKPRLSWAWLLFLGVVLFSTLFTKQHYLLDVVAGILVGVAAVRLSSWVECFNKYDKPRVIGG